MTAKAKGSNPLTSFTTSVQTIGLEYRSLVLWPMLYQSESVSSSVMVFYFGLGGVVNGHWSAASMDGNNRIVFDIASIPYDEWLILIMLGEVDF